MPIKPPLPRHTVEKLENAIRVILPSKKRVFIISLQGIGILIWAYMTGTAFFMFVVMLSIGTGIFDKPDAPGAGNISLIVSAIFFLACLQLLAMGLVIVYSFLWQIAGKEIIEVNFQTITLTRQIFGWKKSSEYFANAVSDVRVSQPNVGFGFKRIIQNLFGLNGIIAFDYGAKTFRFGLEIEEAEAKQIIAVIKEGLPQPKMG